MVVTDDYINKIFEGTNFGETINSSVSEKRALIRKTLKTQVEGRWSGHTAYNIVVNSGFLIDAKPSQKKVLTLLGELFLNQ